MNAKWLGAIVGYLLFGPLGALLGWWLAGQANIQGNWHFGSDQSESQATFFRVTFQVMGHLAKADGRVSEREIDHAREVMARMGLNQRMRQQAISYFNQGKQADFDLMGSIDQLKQACGWHPILMQMFVQIQAQAVQADGKVSSAQQGLLKGISDRLGVSGQQYQGGGWGQWSGQQGSYQRGSSGSSSSSASSLQECYRILGVKSDVTQAVLKKTYRKLMSEYHPDKLIAKGLPESMIKVATEKTQSIKSAYEQICSAKGWK